MVPNYTVKYRRVGTFLANSLSANLTSPDSFRVARQPPGTVGDGNRLSVRNFVVSMCAGIRDYFVHIGPYPGWCERRSLQPGTAAELSRCSKTNPGFRVLASSLRVVRRRARDTQDFPAAQAPARSDTERCPS